MQEADPAFKLFVLNQKMRRLNVQYTFLLNNTPPSPISETLSVSVIGSADSSHFRWSAAESSWGSASHWNRTTLQLEV
jgi:hypothetical protein